MVEEKDTAAAADDGDDVEHDRNSAIMPLHTLLPYHPTKKTSLNVIQYFLCEFASDRNQL